MIDQAFAYRVKSVFSVRATVTFSFYTMHLSVQFNHFNCAHWVAVRCEASEATPTVAEASEASGSYL